MNTVSRKFSLGGQCVFVDGQAGCGKTLISRVISSFERVELLSYVEEIEQYCSLSYLQKIEPDVAEVLIRLKLDLQLYNTMMARNLNFRPTDLSSVFQHHDPNLYLQRIFEKGDSSIPNKISEESPILNLAVHNLIAFSEPLWSSLGNRCAFIEVVRHPLYMIRQQILNFEDKKFEGPRTFYVQYSYKGEEVPYFVKGWEEAYLGSNSTEKAIHYIKHLTELTNTRKQELFRNHHASILTIPFEPFVLDPLPWLKKISDLIGT